MKKSEFVEKFNSVYDGFLESEKAILSGHLLAEESNHDVMFICILSPPESPLTILQYNRFHI